MAPETKITIAPAGTGYEVLNLLLICIQQANSPQTQDYGSCYSKKLFLVATVP